MLDSIINAFNTLKIENAQKISQSLDGISDETNFLDDNYIVSEIGYLRSNIAKIQKATDISKSEQAKIIIKLNEQIAILAANNAASFETSKSILHMIKSDFEMCVDAMINALEGDINSAISQFDTFWKSHDYVYSNYLAPNMYAELLLKHSNRVAMAINCLSISLQLRPGDIQTRKAYRDALYKAGELTSAGIQDSIIKALGEKL